MVEKKKKFKIPEAEVVDFANDDIITLSGESQKAMDANGVWGDDDNTEVWGQ